MAIDKQTFTRAAKAALLWGIEQAGSEWQDVADTEDSNELSETYDSFSPPGAVQEDSGPGYEPETGVRFAYTITNKTWTVSLDVKKDSLNDDQLGAFRNRIQLLGRRMSNHLTKRCFDRLFAVRRDRPLDAPGHGRCIRFCERLGGLGGRASRFA